MKDLDNLSREQLFMWVNQLSFCADDMMLYLDTHPDDKDALEYYNQCREVLKMAKIGYESKYGAFTLCNVSKLSEWNWNEGPYPWDNSEGGMR